MNTIGIVGEMIAWRYLRNKKYSILERNFYIRGGEIDLIALDDRSLVFVEIKTRTQQEFGAGSESIGFNKKRSLRRTISAYLQSGKVHRHAPGAHFVFSYDRVRFDVIDILLDMKKSKILTFIHYKNSAL